MSKIIKLSALSLIIAAAVFAACKSKNIVAQVDASSPPDVYVVGQVVVPWQEDKLERSISVFTLRDTTIVVPGRDKYHATVWKNGIAQFLTDGTEWAMAHSVFAVGENVYVAGVEGDVAKLWKNGVEQRLDVKGSSVANSVFVYGNDVYVAGHDEIESFADGIATVWKNGIAQHYYLTDGTKRTSEALSVFVSDNDVYVAGHVDYVGALWKNGIAQNLYPMIGANSVFVSGNDVYVAGDGGNEFEAGERIYRQPFALLWKNGEAMKLGNENTMTVSSFDEFWENMEVSRALSVFVSGADVYVLWSGFVIKDQKMYTMMWKNGASKEILDTETVFKNGSVFVSGNDVFTIASSKLWKNGIEQNLAVPENAKSSLVFSIFVK